MDYFKIDSLPMLMAHMGHIFCFFVFLFVRDFFFKLSDTARKAAVFMPGHQVAVK